MTDPTIEHERLIGRTVRILNTDRDMVNVRDVKTGEQFWIESKGDLQIFRSAQQKATA